MPNGSMSWTLLFIKFILTFLIMNSINIFTTIYNPQMKKYSKTLNKINWKR